MSHLKYTLLSRFINVIDGLRTRAEESRIATAGVLFDQGGRIYSINNQTFAVPGDELTDLRFRSRFILGGYECSEEYDLVSRYLERDKGLIELGGCLGVMTCFANSLLQNRGRHAVLEAHPQLMPWLASNIERNNCKATALNGVLSRHDEEMFYIHPLIVGGSLLRQTPSKISVPGVSIKNIEQIAGSPTNIIMDIEGGELALLRSDPAILCNCDTLFIELHPFSNILTTQQAAECESCLSSNGFNKIDTDTSGHYQVWKRPHG